MREKQAKGLPVKPGIWRILASRAELEPHLVADWEAFWFLHQGRPIGGFGSGPIPLADILTYAEMHEIVGEEREQLIWVVRMLDRAYLEFEAERAPHDGNNGAGSKDRRG